MAARFFLKNIIVREIIVSTNTNANLQLIARPYQSNVIVITITLS